MYLSVIIPIIGLLAYMLYQAIHNRKVFNIIILAPIPIVLLLIFISRSIFEYSGNTSTEYRGYLVHKAVYNEYWDTWVTRTCSVPCGEDCSTDSDGNVTCVTVYCNVDCSYCDRNYPYWDVYDQLGRSYSIDDKYYNKLIKQWSATPVHINKNRNIKYKNGCGCDGNAYSIEWDTQLLTSEAVYRLESYKNHMKLSQSAFNYTEIPLKERLSKGVYDYPKTYEFYKQKPVLGLDSLNIHSSDKYKIIKMYEYLNGLGHRTHNKTFILLFPDKDINLATLQENHWTGGNRNELVICIGYDSKSNKLTWVKPFSWTDNKRVSVEIREELMKMDTLDLIKAYPMIYRTIDKYFKPKDFEDFNYLSIDYPKGLYTFSWVSSLILTCIGIYLTKHKF